MSAQGTAVSDQITAIIRDLTPGQRVALIESSLCAINQTAVELQRRGEPDGGAIALVSAMATLALAQIAVSTPIECVAAPLAAIKSLLESGAKA